jgi:hypothetical protein
VPTILPRVTVTLTDDLPRMPTSDLVANMMRRSRRAALAAEERAERLRRIGQGVSDPLDDLDDLREGWAQRVRVGARQDATDPRRRPAPP